jgi:hypothetical protein
LYDVRDVLSFEIDYFVSDEATIATIDTFYGESAENSSASHGADSGIHAGSITAGSKNAHAFYLCHIG